MGQDGIPSLLGRQVLSGLQGSNSGLKVLFANKAKKSPLVQFLLLALKTNLQVQQLVE